MRGNDARIIREHIIVYDAYFHTSFQFLCTVTVQSLYSPTARSLLVLLFDRTFTTRVTSREMGPYRIVWRMLPTRCMSANWTSSISATSHQ